MQWLKKTYGKLWWSVALLMIFPNAALWGSNFDRQLLRNNRQALILPQIWLGSDLLHFSFYIQPLPIYPEIPGLYPCFPYDSCMVLQPFPKYERHKKRLKPESVFKDGKPLVDDAMEAWRAGLRQAVEPFRTDERQIVPIFREHSLIRSEYQNVGNVLPEFLANEESKATEKDHDHESAGLDEPQYPDTSLFGR